MGSDKVEETSVYGADGKKIGTIKRLIVSGKVAYAVISFGEFLGLGADCYRIPYTSLGGYRVDIIIEDNSRMLPSSTRIRTGIGPIGPKIGRYTIIIA